MRQNKIFADAFNYFIYNGEQVIQPDSLKELDTREIEVPYGSSGAEQPVQRTRDVIKSVTAMTDQRVAYLLLAVENQAEVHYAMPVRNMVQDGLQYAKQVEKAAASHKEAKDYKGHDRSEFLSGFMKTDRLLPVVTLVIYFGAKEWDGPRSIHEMFALQDKTILALVPDYKINLITPADISDEDFEKFHSSLKEVLAFIKYSDPAHADKLNTVVNKEALFNFHALGRTEVDVLNYCVNSHLAVGDKQEVIDVCGAIEELNRRAAEKAAAETAKKVTEEVEKEAEKKRILSLLSAVKSLMQKMEWSSEQSMNAMSISAEDREILLPLLH